MEFASFLFVFIVTFITFIIIHAIWNVVCMVSDRRIHRIHRIKAGAAVNNIHSTDSTDLLQKIHHFVQTSPSLQKALSKHELFLLRDREPFLQWSFFDQNQNQKQNQNQDQDENVIAFTENKMHLNVCLDTSHTEQNTNTNTNTKRKQNALVYIILHELAHVATDLNEETHGPQFYERFAKIARAAQRDGLYQLDDYAKSPLSYCGRTLKHQVLSDH